MTATFDLFGQPIFEATDSAISSPGSADGRLRSTSRAGRRTVQSGPDHVHVSRFRALDSAAALPTSDTSGPLFTASSPSANLQRCLENKLRSRMDLNGSPECVLTWQTQDMPLGLALPRLRASVRRTCATGRSLWPTVRASDGEKGGPNARDGSGSLHLPAEAHRTHLWNTPTARDGKSVLASPATHAANSRPLSEQVGAAMGLWATVTICGNNNRVYPGKGASGDGLATQAHGATPNGDKARTAKSGALNPEFVCWLMGYAVSWLFAAPLWAAARKSTATVEPARSRASETRSSRKSRPSS